jgi:hypothetical protein
LLEADAHLESVAIPSDGGVPDASLDGGTDAGMMIVPDAGPSSVVTRDFGFESGTVTRRNTPPGQWDDLELSGTSSVASVTSIVAPGFTHSGRFHIAAGSVQTQTGWHVRALSADYGTTLHPGDEIWQAAAVYVPSADAENTGGVYDMAMLQEIHNSNNIVHSMIAPFMFLVHTPQDTWDGTRWGTPADTHTPALVFRLATGYVPGGQGGPATNQTYWHPGVLIPGFQPFPYDTWIWLVLHIRVHEFAGGSPPGGLNMPPNTLPVFTGSDTQPGLVEIWALRSNTMPSASAFPAGAPTLRLTNVPTAVYTNNGGAVVHDSLYMLQGPYSGADSVSRNQTMYSAGVFWRPTFASAVSRLTGGP